jgi:hypothetical protein
MKRSRGIEMRIGMDASLGTKSPAEGLLIGRPWALLFLCSGVLSPAAQSQDTGLVTLPHHVVAALSSATRLPHTASLRFRPRLPSAKRTYPYQGFR